MPMQEDVEGVLAGAFPSGGDGRSRPKDTWPSVGETQATIMGRDLSA